MSLYDPNPNPDYTLNPGTPGPVTPTGVKARKRKAINSKNNLRHAMLAEALLLPRESLETFGDFIRSLEAALQPVGPIETARVESMAISRGRQVRFMAMQTASLEIEISRQSEPDPAARACLAVIAMADQKYVRLMIRCESSNERQYNRSLADLFEARKRRHES
jgi:hypothetical protein